MTATNYNDHEAACALCLRVAELCNSHIIPAWAFKLVKHGGRYLKLDYSKNETDSDQTDLAKELLCSDCERRMKVFDDKAAWLYQHVTVHASKVSHSDRNQLAGFALSVMWRWMAAGMDEMAELEVINVLRPYLLGLEPPPAQGFAVQAIYFPQAVDQVWMPQWHRVAEGLVFTFAVPKTRFWIFMGPQMVGSTLLQRSQNTTMDIVYRQTPKPNARAQKRLDKLKKQT